MSAAANAPASYSDRICAMQVLPGGDGSPKMGLLTQLARNAEFEICGPGFNERTLKVSVAGHFYFVFREDLERLQLPCNQQTEIA